MIIFKPSIFICLILFLSCNKQSSPYGPTGSDNYVLDVSMDGDARDFAILNDINIDNFLNSTGERIIEDCSLSGEDEIPSCEERYWCKIDGEQCVSDTKDLIVVANSDESMGLLIYEIINEPNLSYQLVYQNNEIEYEDPSSGEENLLDTELRSIYYFSSKYLIYTLDKFELVYSIFLPGILSDFISPFNIETAEQTAHCLEGTVPIQAITQTEINSGSYHSTQFKQISETVPIGFLVLNKWNTATNGGTNLGGDEVLPYVHHSKIHYLGYNAGHPPLEPENMDPQSDPIYSACTGDGGPSLEALDLFYWGDSEEGGYELDYNVTDFSFSNNILEVANPKDGYYSYRAYNLGLEANEFNGSLESNLTENTQKVEWLVPSKIRSIYSKNGHTYLGLENNGCYITTQTDFSDCQVGLCTFNIVDNAGFFEIADGFTVYNVYYDDTNDLLLLSCGSSGVLIYEWHENGVAPIFSAHVTSSYAYSAQVFNSNYKYLMISTTNGIEVYNIGG